MTTTVAEPTAATAAGPEPIIDWDKVLRQKGAHEMKDWERERRDQLTEAVRRFRNRADFRTWLEGIARFRRYSLANTILIWLQRPDATRVAGAKAWWNLGYKVKKGTTKIGIWLPTGRRFTKTEIDPDTGEQRQVTVRARGGYCWRKVLVDQADVEPRPDVDQAPLDAPFDTTIGGDSHAHLLAALAGYAGTLGYHVEFGETGGAHGFTRPSTRLIRIADTLAANDQATTLAHEAAHALGAGYERFGRPRAEVIVEVVAHLFCLRHGLDTGAIAIPYVATWSNDADEVIERDWNAILALLTHIERGVDAELERLAAQQGAPAPAREEAVAA